MGEVEYQYSNQHSHRQKEYHEAIENNLTSEQKTAHVMGRQIVNYHFFINIFSLYTHFNSKKHDSI
jgi:hypothetical protein